MRTLCKIRIQLAGKYLVKNTNQPNLEVRFTVSRDRANWVTPYDLCVGYYVDGEIEQLESRLDEVNDHYINVENGWDEPDDDNHNAFYIEVPTTLTGRPVTEFYLSGVDNMYYRIEVYNAPKLREYLIRTNRGVPETDPIILSSDKIRENVSLEIVENDE